MIGGSSHDLPHAGMVDYAFVNACVCACGGLCAAVCLRSVRYVLEVGMCLCYICVCVRACACVRVHFVVSARTWKCVCLLACVFVIAFAVCCPVCVLVGAAYAPPGAG